MILELATFALVLVIGIGLGAAGVLYYAKDVIQRSVEKRREAVALIKSINSDPEFDLDQLHKYWKSDGMMDYSEQRILTSSHIRDMDSWDRASVAVDRAKKGLAPNDDLVGMDSWDIVKVEKARTKYAINNAEQ